MPEDHSARGERFATRLSHAGRAGTKVRGFVNPPVHRGSTMLAHRLRRPRIDAASSGSTRRATYGVHGNATHHALEDVIAEIEGGTRCQIVSSGLAAVTTPLLAYLEAGEHCLMPDSVYGPARTFCHGTLAPAGGRDHLLRPDHRRGRARARCSGRTPRCSTSKAPAATRSRCRTCRRLAEVAHRRGAKVLMDNTWGIHHFQPFQHGVDVSIQALTKYRGRPFRRAARQHHRCRPGRSGSGCGTGALALGQYASPDDCWLAPARRADHGRAAASGRCSRRSRSPSWLAGRGRRSSRCCTRRCRARRAMSCGSAISPVPAACSAWCSSRNTRSAATQAMIDSLTLFGIGASWGGFESLALPTTGYAAPHRRQRRFRRPDRARCISGWRTRRT